MREDEKNEKREGGVKEEAEEEQKEQQQQQQKIKNKKNKTGDEKKNNKEEKDNEDKENKIKKKEMENIVFFGKEDDPVRKELAERIADLTPNCSPATLTTIVNEAALTAAVQGASFVRLEHFLSAIDDVLVGKKQRDRSTDEARRRVALHESGHTLVAWMQSQQQPVVKLSISPRGQAAGFTQQLEREKLDSLTDEMMFSDICVLLGGRVAEETKYSTLSSGAADDLQKATRSALMQCLSLGMNPRVGLLAHDPQRMQQGRGFQHYTRELQAHAEEEAQWLVKCAYNATKKLIEENKEKLNILVESLLKKKELLKVDLEEILGVRPEITMMMHPFVAEEMKAYMNNGRGGESG